MRFFSNIGKNLADKINNVPHKQFSDYLVSKHDTKFAFQPVEIKEVNKIISQLDSKNSWKKHLSSTLRSFWNMQIRTFYGSKSNGVFILHDKHDPIPQCQVKSMPVS